MSKVYMGQTALKIIVETKTDLTTATAQIIKFIKPDGVTGNFSAVVDSPEYGVISYEVVSASDLDQEGEWTFWAHITFAGGKIAAGEPFCLIINKEGV